MFEMPSTPTLNRIPEKTVRFITALRRTPQTLAALEAAGLTPADLEEGLTLLRLATQPVAEPASSSGGTGMAAAGRRLALEGLPFLERVEATLSRQLPVLTDEIFAGIDDCPALVTAMDRVLDRLEGLNADPRPVATAALILLESRGLGAAVRQDFRSLLASVRGEAPNELPLRDAETEATRAARTDALVRLYQWHQRWSRATADGAQRSFDFSAGRRAA